MSQQLFLPVELGAMLLQKIQLLNSDPEIGVVIIIAKQNCPPEMMGSFDVETIYDLLKFILDNREAASIDMTQFTDTIN